MRVIGRLLLMGLGLLGVSRGAVLAQQVEIPHPTLPTCNRSDPTLLLPDLVPDPPTSLQQLYVQGRRAIEFTTSVANIGDGPYIMEGRTVSTPTGLRTQAWEIISRRDGSKCAHAAGQFSFHPEHQHFHFDDFVGYELRSDDPITGALATTGEKVSFCLIDIARVRGFRQDLFPRQLTNQTCDSQEGFQGISVGWKDVYERFLPGQDIVLDQDAQHQVPVGVYFLVNNVDPTNVIWEKDKTNNTSWEVTSVTLPPPAVANLPPPFTPRPRPPHIHPGRPGGSRATRTPRGGGVPPPTATPTMTPAAGGGRPPRGPHAERPTRTPRGGVPGGDTPTPTSAPGNPPPTPTAPPSASGPLAPCDNACSYAVSQIRMTWYYGFGLNLSMFVGPRNCPAINPSAADIGAIGMDNFLTERRSDTGLQYSAGFVMSDGFTGAGDNNGIVAVSPTSNGVHVQYTAEVPPLASSANGLDFPVVFDLCFSVGGEAVKARLVCQPHSQGMLCHQG